MNSAALDVCAQPVTFPVVAGAATTERLLLEAVLSPNEKSELAVTPRGAQLVVRGSGGVAVDSSEDESATAGTYLRGARLAGMERPLLKVATPAIAG